MADYLDECELENKTQDKKLYKLERVFFQGKDEMGWVEQTRK